MSANQSQQFPNSVGLTSTDMKRSIQFYRDKLGFQLKECWPSEQNAMWASLILDGQSIMFGQAMEDVASCESSHPMSDAQKKFWTKQTTRFKQNEKGAGVN